MSDEEANITLRPISLEEQRQAKGAKGGGPKRPRLREGQRLFTRAEMRLLETERDPTASDDCPSLRFKKLGNRRLNDDQRASVLPRGSPVEWVRTTIIHMQQNRRKEGDSYAVTRDVVRVAGLEAWTYRSLLARSHDEAMSDAPAPPREEVPEEGIVEDAGPSPEEVTPDQLDRMAARESRRPKGSPKGRGKGSNKGRRR